MDENVTTLLRALREAQKGADGWRASYEYWKDKAEDLAVELESVRAELAEVRRLDCDGEGGEA